MEGEKEIPKRPTTAYPLFRCYENIGLWDPYVHTKKISPLETELLPAGGGHNFHSFFFQTHL